MNHIFSSENRPFVSSRLRTRSILFVLIGIVLLALTAYDVAVGQVIWWMATLGLVAGLLFGYGFGRLTRVRWHEDENKVVTQMDVLYVVLIIGYLALSFARRALLGDLLTGAALLAVSYAVAAGILLGRFAGLHRNIMKLVGEKRS